ncbi:DNA repair protein RecO [Chakrabartia godavariana]|nr:DNA repair protein RecO [Chakrabartia godavariana]
MGSAVIIRTPAIVCSVRHHGEHGVIVRLMTPDHGLVAGYVRGGRSRTMRPVLMPANLVTAEFRARLAGQLAGVSVELVQSRAPLMSEPLAALALEWCCALTSVALPDEQTYPVLFQSLAAVLSAVEAGDIVRDWAGALAGYELLLLRALGYGTQVGAMPQDWPETFALLNANGAKLERHILQGRTADLLSARARLIDRLKRAVA